MATSDENHKGYAQLVWPLKPKTNTWLAILAVLTFLYVLITGITDTKSDRITELEKRIEVLEKNAKSL